MRMDIPIGYTLFPIVLSILSLLTSIYVYRLQQTNEEDQRPRKEVAVCVLSARDHFSQRMTLRDTWVGGIQSNPDLNQRMRVWFVVGSRDCDIAPEDRMDAYDCVPRPLPSMDLMEDQDMAAFSMLETKDNIPLQMGSTRIAVQVLESMSLKRIGIPEFLPVDNGFTVTLVLANQSEVVHDSADFLHVKFSPVDPGIRHHGYRYQPVLPVFLERGENVILSLSRGKGGETGCCKMTMHDFKRKTVAYLRQTTTFLSFVAEAAEAASY